MQDKPDEKSRQVVPRWRLVAQTNPLELKSASRRKFPAREDIFAQVNAEIDRTKSAWAANPSLHTASEFVAASMRSERAEEAVGAAKLIRAPQSTATDLAKRIAENFHSPSKFKGALSFDLPDDWKDHLDNTISRRDTVAHALAKLRHRIRKYPKDAILHANCARLHSILGQGNKAIHEMDMAAILAPHNRYILRSASRLFVHYDQADRALWLLHRNPGTQDDPWLLSAEVALSDIAGKFTRYNRRAKVMLGDKQFSSFQISELASAMATISMQSGSNRHAKVLYKKSLIEPTDNAVAQGVWAAKMMNIGFDEHLLYVQDTFEARAINAFSDEKPELAILNTMLWMHDEPFSLRPAILGSYIAHSWLTNSELCLRIADAGLVANPKSPTLRNNKIVALAELGKLEEASTEMRALKVMYHSEISPALFATEGLIHFRNGNIIEGRNCYKQAIDIALSNNDMDVAIRAKTHLISEEVLSGNEDAYNGFSEIIHEVDKFAESKYKGTRVTVSAFKRKISEHLKLENQN